jgi:ABC-type nitrate/sulfonate/bicarbonate transport system permease component
MLELETTWTRVISVGWLIIWRGTLGAFLVGFAIGFLVGFVFGLIQGASGTAGASQETIRLIITVLTVPAALAWWMLVVRMALRKRYKGFRLALVSTTE